MNVLRAFFLFSVGVGLLGVAGFMLPAGELALFAALAGASTLWLAVAA